MFFDIHTHKYIDTGNLAIVNIPVDDFKRVLNDEISGWFSAGIHPFDIPKTDSEIWEKLTNSIAAKRFVALGECGFDKNCNTPFDVQAEYFERQIVIAEKYEKPVIIHCVGYFNELMALKKQINPTQMWIIHGFRGKPQLAVQLLKAGFFLSFGEKFNAESVRITPTDKIFAETDESKKSIIEIYHNLALAKQCKPEELVAGTRLFKKIS